MRRRTHNVWGVLALVLGVCPPAAHGQGRNALVAPQLQGLRGLSTVGGDFTNYSYGLGGLRGGGAPGDSGVLTSNIYSSSGYNVYRSAAGGTTAGDAFTSAAKTAGGAAATARPGMNLMGLSDAMGLPARSGGMDADKEAIASLGPYLAVMSYTGQLRPEDDKPVTSFVPAEPSLYQSNMQRGDQAFRAGRYEDACGAFNVVTIVARRAPEGHLSMVNALFALGQYYSASSHLREALKLLPELPLVNLQVRGFYGTVEDYVKHQEALRRRAEGPYPDPDLLLLLAYIRYFDGAEPEAVDALRKAAGAVKDPGLRESVETFWDGMVAAGKASGELVATRPAESATRPAPPATGPASRSPEGRVALP